MKTRAPGHPEQGHTARAQTTTGPLGQGLTGTACAPGAPSRARSPSAGAARRARAHRRRPEPTRGRGRAPDLPLTLTRLRPTGEGGGRRDPATRSLRRPGPEATGQTAARTSAPSSAPSPTLPATTSWARFCPSSRTTCTWGVSSPACERFSRRARSRAPGARRRDARR
ncbi:hypothetical protein [Streptomyces sp. NPDC003697]